MAFGLARGYAFRRVGHQQVFSLTDVQNSPVAGIPVGTDNACVQIFGRSTANQSTQAVGLYVESQVAGASTGTTYGTGLNLRFKASATALGGGSIYTPLRCGIGDRSSTTFSSGAILVFGMKAEFTPSGTVSTTDIYPFSINNTQTTRAIFYCQDTGGDVGYIANTGTSSTKEGDVPLFASSNGQQHYVRIYDARG